MINQDGIQLENTTPTEFGKYSWPEIKEIAIKVFPNSYSGEPHLLFITKEDKLIDVDLSLLKTKQIKFLDKDEWLKTLKIKTEDYNEIKGCIQNYSEYRLDEI